MEHCSSKVGSIGQVQFRRNFVKDSNRNKFPSGIKKIVAQFKFLQSAGDFFILPESTKMMCRNDLLAAQSSLKIPLGCEFAQ